jgi:beta-lactamase class A
MSEGLALPSHAASRLARRVLGVALASSIALSAGGGAAAAPLPAPSEAPAAEALAAETPAPEGTPAAETPAPPAQESAAPTPTPSALDEVLRGIAARYGGRLGVVVKHLGTGETASLNADQHFRAASLYKLWVLHSVFARIESGQIDPGATLTMSEKALEDEQYSEWPVGTEATLDCALRSMVLVSSNAASAMLLGRVGGETQVTADLYDLGFTHSFLTPDYAGTTPSDLARLLEMIGRRQAVSPTASDAMLSLLVDQQRNDRVPLPLPPEVAVAHKTGELTRLRNDAAIVFAPSGASVLVVLTDAAPSTNAARNAVVDVSRAVYSYFEPGNLPSYQGLPPRLAREVLQTPDEQGRLPWLQDEWAQTLDLAKAGVGLVDGHDDASLRDVAVPDLAMLQSAAAAAGVPFWIKEGYRSPTDKDTKVLPIDDAGCRVRQPPRTANTKLGRAVATPVPPKTPVPVTFVASQHWLGTVVTVADSASDEAESGEFAQSRVGGWLLAHAWEYGYVPAPAESPSAERLGYEPWTLRWVGREMAARLQARTGGDPTAVAAELRAASRELANLTAVRTRHHT